MKLRHRVDEDRAEAEYEDGADVSPWFKILVAVTFTVGVLYLLL